MNSTELTVRQVMQPEPVCVPPDTPIREAMRLMNRQRIGAVLVVRDSNQLVGIFTERDLLKRVLAVGKPLADPLIDVMTENPASVRINEPIRTAIRTMEEGGYRHLPVVDENNRPVGVLSAKRIVRYLVEHFPALVHNQPPAPNQYPESAEGA